MFGDEPARSCSLASHTRRKREVGYIVDFYLGYTCVYCVTKQRQGIRSVAEDSHLLLCFIQKATNLCVTHWHLHQCCQHDVFL